MREILERSTLQLSAGWKTILWALVIVGLLTFLIGLAVGSPERSWQTFLINTVFWGGIAQAGVILAAIWQITDAKWGRPFKRIAEGFGAFLPIAFIAFIAVMFGAGHVYKWVHHPMEAKAGYLNLGFFSVRNVIGMVILFGLSWVFIRMSIKPDVALARQLIPGWGGSFADRLLRGYGEHETEVVRLEQRSRRLAPLLTFLYAVIGSMMAIDYVMSLDQEWFSTLFPVFFLIGSIYAMLALMLIIGAGVRVRLPLVAEYLSLNRYNDMAKLTFAFAMGWTYMIFSQYLVIWYSNLPEETPYLIERSIMPGLPWYNLFWTLFVVLFLFPFLALMPRTFCRIPKLMALFGLILFIGQWFAHYMMVVPSVQAQHAAEPHFLFGLTEILVTLGFTGAFFLAFFTFMSRVPTLPISDKHLCKTWHGH